MLGEIMVKVDIYSWSERYKRFITAVTTTVSRRIINAWGEAAVRNMKEALRPWRREHITLFARVPDMHFADSLVWIPTGREKVGEKSKTMGLAGAIAARYTRKGALVALSIDRGRRGYAKLGARGVIYFEKGHSEPLGPAGTRVFRRKVGPASPRPYIHKSLRAATAEIPHMFRTHIKEHFDIEMGKGELKQMIVWRPR